MLALADKSLLVKFSYLSQESLTETFRNFRMEKKMKKGSGLVTLSGLISLTRHFEKPGCLQNRPIKEKF